MPQSLRVLNAAAQDRVMFSSWHILREAARRERVQGKLDGHVD